MPSGTVPRAACLLTVLAAARSGPTPGPGTGNRGALRAGVDSAADRLLTALRTNASDSLLALMADDVVLMPPNEAVLRGKPAVRAWYDNFLTQLRTSGLTLSNREVFVGGEWATEVAGFEWTLAPVGRRTGGRRSRQLHAAYGTGSRTDDGASVASCGTARLRRWRRRRRRDPVVRADPPTWLALRGLPSRATGYLPALSPCARSSRRTGSGPAPRSCSCTSGRAALYPRAPQGARHDRTRGCNHGNDIRKSACGPPLSIPRASGR